MVTSEGSSVRSLPSSGSLAASLRFFFFPEVLIADPDAADEFLVSIPCTSAAVVDAFLFSFFLLMHLEPKGLKRIR